MTESDLGIDSVVGNGVLRITINRPQRRNSLDRDATHRMVELIDAAPSDESVRAIVITGAGDHFCPGADLTSANERGDRRPRIGHLERALAAGAHRLIQTIWETQLPVIAGVRGVAAGLGCNLALVCDYVVAARSASFWYPFAARGFTPDSGSTFLLPRLVGTARAKQILMLGRQIDGATAFEWGMVTELVDDGDLGAAIDRIAAEFAAGATVAVGLTKWAVNHALELDLAHAMHQEAMVEELAIRSPDFKEGIAAFHDKRPPNYTGR